MHIAESFRSVGDVWIVWGACALALVGTAYLRLRRCDKKRVCRALQDERGATYVLPYLLTFPIYLLTMCLMIQSTQIIVVKLFTMRAASAAVRSAVVWRSADPESDRAGANLAVERAHYAAAIAMTPVASSQQRHLRNPLLDSTIFHKPTGLDWAYLRESIYHNTRAPYGNVYRTIASDNIRRDAESPSPLVRAPDEIPPQHYYDQKLRYAAWATRVEVDSAKKYNVWNHPYTVELVYLMPMNIPGAGRLLGQFHGWNQFHARLIVTRASMPMETPKSKNRRIGIGYDPAMLR